VSQFSVNKFMDGENRLMTLISVMDWNLQC